MSKDHIVYLKAHPWLHYLKRLANEVSVRIYFGNVSMDELMHANLIRSLIIPAK